MAALLVVLCVVVTGRKESHFIHNPQTYDARSEHIIPLEIRGTGTVYLTPSESRSLEPYNYAAYAALALVVMLVVGGRLIERKK